MKKENEDLNILLNMISAGKAKNLPEARKLLEAAKEQGKKNKEQRLKEANEKRERFQYKNRVLAYLAKIWSKEIAIDTRFSGNAGKVELAKRINSLTEEDIDKEIKAMKDRDIAEEREAAELKAKMRADLEAKAAVKKKEEEDHKKKQAEEAKKNAVKEKEAETVVKK